MTARWDVLKERIDHSNAILKTLKPAHNPQFPFDIPRRRHVVHRLHPELPLDAEVAVAGVMRLSD
jgi:hypothetical protein